MLRKDTIHMIKSEWEPRVPETWQIKEQMEKGQVRLAGSVRAALGKVIGAFDNSSPLSKK